MKWRDKVVCSLTFCGVAIYPTPSKHNQFSLQSQILWLWLPLLQLPPLHGRQAVPWCCPPSPSGADQGSGRGGLGGPGGTDSPSRGLSCLPWPGHQGLRSRGRRDGILLGGGGRREPLRAEMLRRSSSEHPVILVNLGTILRLNLFLIIGSESTDMLVTGVREKQNPNTGKYSFWC